jgi:hypothetical protein
MCSKKLMCMVAILLLITVQAIAEEKLVKDKSDVKVYVETLENSEIKKFRGVTTVNSTVSALVALLHDVNNAPAWIYSVTHAEKIEPIAAENQQYHAYMVISAPWPTKDRDNLVENITTQDKTTGIVTVQMQAKPNLRPINKGYVRIPQFAGFWQFKPIAEGMVEVTFSALSDPGGSVPNFIYNTMITDTPFNTLVNLRKMMPLAQKYANTHYSYIND